MVHTGRINTICSGMTGCWCDHKSVESRLMFPVAAAGTNEEFHLSKTSVPSGICQIRAVMVVRWPDWLMHTDQHMAPIMLLQSTRRLALSAHYSQSPARNAGAFDTVTGWTLPVLPSTRKPIFDIWEHTRSNGCINPWGVCHYRQYSRLQRR